MINVENTEAVAKAAVLMVIFIGLWILKGFIEWYKDYKDVHSGDFLLRDES